MLPVRTKVACTNLAHIRAIPLLPLLLLNRFISLKFITDSEPDIANKQPPPEV
jgi:hypothetical protein